MAKVSVLSKVTIVNADEVWRDVSLLIEDGKIKEITTASAFSSDIEVYEFDQPVFALPGFIDTHIHGAAGADVMDANPQALQTIACAIARQGTTAFLPTTMTAPGLAIETALLNVHDYMQQDEQLGAEVLGVHLEGPFLFPKAAGAQNAMHMLAPDLTLFERWQKMSGDRIRLITLAAEYENSCEVIEALTASGVVVGLGHTHADADCVQCAIDAGASYATHLFNAMSGLHHRDSGAAYPLLLSDKVTAEVIADGFHLSPWALKLAWQLKRAESLLLVSDAMRARCMGPGDYQLGSKRVHVSETGCASLEDGVLAGSITNQLSASKWMQGAVGCDMQDIVRMCAYNPAKILGMLERKGSIGVGKDADIVLVNRDLEWINTMCRGRLTELPVVHAHL